VLLLVRRHHRPVVVGRLLLAASGVVLQPQAAFANRPDLPHLALLVVRMIGKGIVVDHLGHLQLRRETSCQWVGQRREVVP
jgi:hypothetical protein